VKGVFDIGTFIRQTLFRLIPAVAILLVVGCDFNPLGGTKSKLDPLFEPGKHTPSAPPVIGAIADFIIDENDVQTIPFTISDPDTFMVCSLVFVKATSSNNTIIDSSGLTVGGTYPNCTLRIAPKAFQFGVVDITVSLYDFWTYARSNFQLTVVHILTPGAFAITDATGGNTTVDITWQNAAYMLTTGAYTSPYYNLYYRTTSPVGAWNEIPRVTSPYTVTGLTNGTEYDFYVLAHNSIGERQSNQVTAQPTRFQFRGAEFVPASTQGDLAPMSGLSSNANAVNPQNVNLSLMHSVPVADATYPALAYDLAAPTGIYEDATPPIGSAPPSSITTPSGRYKVFVNSQSNILSGVGN
jgi:hypothetical protein